MSMYLESLFPRQHMVLLTDFTGCFEVQGQGEDHDKCQPLDRGPLAFPLAR